jgi:hypothetical protein
MILDVGGFDVKPFVNLYVDLILFRSEEAHRQTALEGRGLSLARARGIVRIVVDRLVDWIRTGCDRGRDIMSRRGTSVHRTGDVTWDVRGRLDNRDNMSESGRIVHTNHAGSMKGLITFLP